MLSERFNNVPNLDTIVIAHAHEEMLVRELEVVHIVVVTALSPTGLI